MGSSSKAKVGYKYYLGLHKVLCYGPVDAVTKILVDDREAWSGTNTGGNLTINKPDLFGGESREGGIQGTVTVEMGDSAQAVNSYLNSKIAGDTPAYRGVLALVWNKIYIGINPYLKPWAVQVVRTNTLTDGSPQWLAAKADINGAMNPAHIIRECITNSQWGMGHTANDIDDTTFTAAANTLFDEGFGLSMMWSKQDSFDNFIKDVLKHVSGKLSVSPTEGKFELNLIRQNYSVPALALFDETNIISMDSFERRGWSDTVNEMVVVYTDQETGKDSTVTVQDLANIQIQGGVVSQTVNYTGIPNSDLALRVAQRDLNILSKALAKASITVNRTGHEVQVGDAIRLSWDKLGLVDLVIRVLEVDYGLPSDGRIKITALEDEFSLPDTSYTNVQPSGWSDPRPDPIDVNLARVDEATYWQVTKYVTEADINTFQPSFGFALMSAQQPAGGHYNYDLYTKVGAAAYELGDSGSDFAPTFSIPLEIPQELTSTISYDTYTGILDDNLLGTYAYLGEELVKIYAYDETAQTVSINRGIYDTVPVLHAAGAVLWAIEGYEASDFEEYTDTEIVYCKAATSTGKGTLDVNLATAYSKQMANRYERPYPPGNLKVNGVAYSLTTGQSGGDVITWSHRDRTLQTGDIILQNNGNIGPEVSTTYTLTIFNALGTQIRQETGLTGTSYTYTVANELVDTGSEVVQTKVFYELYSEVSGLLSHQTHRVEINRP